MGRHSPVRDCLLGLGNALVLEAKARWKGIDKRDTGSLELYQQTCER